MFPAFNPISVSNNKVILSLGQQMPFDIPDGDKFSKICILNCIVNVKVSIWSVMVLHLQINNVNINVC